MKEKCAKVIAKIELATRFITDFGEAPNIFCEYNDLHGAHECLSSAYTMLSNVMEKHEALQNKEFNRRGTVGFTEIPPYPTSPALEEIIKDIRLRICEVVMGSDGERHFRLDFSAPGDNGGYFVCGDAVVIFYPDENPRDIAEKLHRLVNALNNYWPKAFPSAFFGQKNQDSP